MAPKLQVAIRLPDVLTINVRAHDTGTNTDVDLAAAAAVGQLFWILDGSSGSSDLLQFLETEINAALGTLGSGATVTWTLDDSTGLVQVLAVSANVDLTWDTSDGTGPWLRDLLGYVRPGDSVGITASTIGNVVGERTFSGGFFPRLCASTDLPRTESDVVQAVSSNGRVETTNYGVINAREITVQLRQASPFTTVWGEFTALQSFLLEAKSGRPFRYYRDKSNAGVFAPVTNPLGYQTLVADPDDTEEDLVPLRGNYYQAFEKKIYARVFVT